MSLWMLCILFKVNQNLNVTQMKLLHCCYNKQQQQKLQLKNVPLTCKAEFGWTIKTNKPQYPEWGNSR